MPYILVPSSLLAFVTDPLLLFSCWWATAELAPSTRYAILGAEIVFMFSTKVAKLVGLFRRNALAVTWFRYTLLARLLLTIAAN